MPVNKIFLTYCLKIEKLLYVELEEEYLVDVFFGSNILNLKLR